MTDQEKVERLLTDLEIPYRIQVDSDDVVSVLIEVDNDRVKGYSCFYTEFRFTYDGKYIDIGIWE